MKKKTFFIVNVFLIMTILNGCVSVPTLSDVQSNQIANYSTALLLKYDANYKSRLVDTATIEAERAIIAAEEQKKLEEEAAIQATIDAEKNINEPVIEPIEEDVYIDIALALGIEGVTVEYAYMEFLDKYPEKEILGVAPVMVSAEENILLVTHFTLTNLLEASNEVNMIDKKVSFRMGINKMSQKNVFSTFLLNDLSNYSGILEAGEMVDLVLISEINEEESSSILSVSMVINIDGDSIKTKLQ
jgi:hypothetical protein